MAAVQNAPLCEKNAIEPARGDALANDAFNLWCGEMTPRDLTHDPDAISLGELYHSLLSQLPSSSPSENPADMIVTASCPS